MSTTRASGLVVPNQDGTDHTREWEHAANLAASIEPRLPKLGATGQPTSTSIAAGASLTVGNVLALTAGGIANERALAMLSLYVITGTAGVDQTVAISLVNLVGCVANTNEDAGAWRLRGTDVLVRRSVLLNVTAAAGGTVSADMKIDVGSGTTALTVRLPRAMIVRGIA